MEWSGKFVMLFAVFFLLWGFVGGADVSHRWSQISDMDEALDLEGQALVDSSDGVVDVQDKLDLNGFNITGVNRIDAGVIAADQQATADLLMNGYSILDTDNVQFSSEKGDVFFVQNNYSSSGGGEYRFQARDSSGVKQLLFRLDPSSAGLFQDLRMNGRNITGIEKVGIGTESPTHSVHIQGSGDEKLKLETLDSSSHAQVQFTKPGQTWSIGQPTTGGDFIFYDDGVGTAMTLENGTGSLGVGTGDPEAPLSLRKSVDAAGEDYSSNPFVLFDNDFESNSQGTALVLEDEAGGGAHKRGGIIMEGSAPASGNRDIYLTNDIDDKSQLMIDENARVGIGTDSPGSRLDVNGSVRAKSLYRSDNSALRVTNPKDGARYWGGSSNTGAIRIKLPTWSRDMMVITADVYEYSSDRAFKIVAGGYTYSASSTWTNTFAKIIGDNPKTTKVRFARNSSNDAWYIVLGDTDTTWSYPYVAITDVSVGYGGEISDYEEGWDISMVQSLPANIDRTIDDARVVSYESDGSLSFDGNLDMNSNEVSSVSSLGVGTGAPEDSLDVRGRAYIQGNGDVGHTTSKIDLSVDDDDTGLNVPSDGTLQLYSNDDVDMTVDGNVDIHNGNLDMNGNSIRNRGNYWWGRMGDDNGDVRWVTSDGNSGTFSMPSDGNTNCDGNNLACVYRDGSRYTIQFEIPSKYTQNWGGGDFDSADSGPGGMCWAATSGDNEMEAGSEADTGALLVSGDYNGHCLGGLSDCAGVTHNDWGSAGIYGVVCWLPGG